MTYRKAFRKYTTCWEDHISTKLKDSKVNHSNIEKGSNPLKQCCKRRMVLYNSNLGLIIVIGYLLHSYDHSHQSSSQLLLI